MRPRDLSTFSLVTQLGFTVVTALVLSLLLGLWLDSRLGTSPLFTLVCSMLGVLVGTIGVYRLVTKAINQAAATMPRPKPRSRTPESQEDGPKDADSPEEDPWADDEDEEDDWDRDPWRDEDDDEAERRRARLDETERRLGIRPPRVKPDKSEEEQR